MISAAAVSSSSSPGVSLSFEPTKWGNISNNKRTKQKNWPFFFRFGPFLFYFSVFVATDLQLANWLVITSLFFPLCYYTVRAGKVLDCLYIFQVKKKSNRGSSLCVHLICQFNVEIRVSAFCVVCVCTYTWLNTDDDG